MRWREWQSNLNSVIQELRSIWIIMKVIITNVKAVTVIVIEATEKRHMRIGQGVVMEEVQW